MKTIETSKLTASDIPIASADYATMSIFALTFNGYQLVKGGPVELGTLCDRIIDDDIENASIDELRALLFMEQRAARFCNDADSEYSLEEMRGLCGLIREKVENNNVDV